LAEAGIIPARGGVRDQPLTPPHRRFNSIAAELGYAAILSISALSQLLRNIQASRWVSK
jgi:hypothetical protein